jgi:hypothetical protein
MAGYRPLRAADLDRHLRELGQGIGDVARQDPRAPAMPIDPRRLIDALRPWVGLS